LILAIPYTTTPLTFLNDYVRNFGNGAVDSAIAAIPALALRTYTSAAAKSMGASAMMSAEMWSSVLQQQQFALAEHHLYGSSRLGVKQYYPDMLCEKWDYTASPIAMVDTLRLTARKPWYSCDVQDVINKDSTQPYNNTDTNPEELTHLLGLKQYEVTDHLGDVMTTISDKRTDVPRVWNGTTAGDSDILTYAPALPSVYDYYPYGMPMPGRTTQDTAQTLHTHNTYRNDATMGVFYCISCYILFRY
jgi:hypothetical protein